MAGALDVARQKKATPSKKPYIDWTNPITKSLVFCWFYPYGDLVASSVRGASGTTFIHSNSAFGVSADSSGSRYELWTNNVLNVSGPSSAMVVGAFTRGAAATSAFFGMGTGGTALYIYNDATDHIVAVGANTCSARLSASVLNSSNSTTAIQIATWSGGGSSTSGTVKLYFNGSTASGTAVCGTRTAGPIYIGTNAGSIFSNSFFKSTCIWNRTLSDREAQTLTTDPFVFIRSR